MNYFSVKTFVNVLANSYVACYPNFKNSLIKEVAAAELTTRPLLTFGHIIYRVACISTCKFPSCNVS